MTNIFENTSLKTKVENDANVMYMLTDVANYIVNSKE